MALSKVRHASFEADEKCFKPLTQFIEDEKTSRVQSTTLLQAYPGAAIVSESMLKSMKTVTEAVDGLISTTVQKEQPTDLPQVFGFKLNAELLQFIGMHFTDDRDLYIVGYFNSRQKLTS